MFNYVCAQIIVMMCTIITIVHIVHSVKTLNKSRNLGLNFFFNISSLLLGVNELNVKYK